MLCQLQGTRLDEKIGITITAQTSWFGISARTTENNSSHYDEKKSWTKAYRLSNNTYVINSLYDQYLLWSVLLQTGQFDYHTQETESDYYLELHRPPYKTFYSSN